MNAGNRDDLTLARDVAAELEEQETRTPLACPQCRGTSSHKLGCTYPAAMAWRAERAEALAAEREQRPF